MISKLIYIIFFIALILGSGYLTKALTRRFRINRWVVGFMAPFVLIIPAIAFKEINTIVWNILIVIFCIMCIMFFEITRTLLENDKIKGVTDYKKK